MKIQIDDKVLDKFDFDMQNNSDLKFYILSKNKETNKIVQIYEPESVGIKIQTKADKNGDFCFEPLITSATFSNGRDFNLINSKGDAGNIIYEIALLGERKKVSDANEQKSKLINLIKIADENSNKIINTFSNSPFFLNEDGKIQSKKDNSVLETVNAFRRIYNTTDDEKPFFRSTLENDKFLNREFVEGLEEFYKNSIKGKTVSEVINAGEELQLLKEFSKDVIENIVYTDKNNNIKVDKFKIVDIDTANQNEKTPYGSYSFEANIKMNVNGIAIDDMIKFETNEQSFIQSFSEMLQRNDVMSISNNDVAKIENGNFLGDKNLGYEILVGNDGYISGNIEKDKIVGRVTDNLSIELINDDEQGKVANKFSHVRYGEIDDMFCEKAEFAKKFAKESMQFYLKEFGLDKEVAILFKQDGYTLNLSITPLLPKDDENIASPFALNKDKLQETKIALKPLMSEDSYNQICLAIQDTQHYCQKMISSEVEEELVAKYGYIKNSGGNELISDDFSMSDKNKAILDNLYNNTSLKIEPISGVYGDGYSMIRVSAGGSATDIEIFNNDLNPLINELKSSIRNFDNPNADPTFFGGNEMLSVMLKEKDIDALKSIVEQDTQREDETSENKAKIRKM